MAEKPTCNKCGGTHWRFQKCPPELPDSEVFEQPAPREVPPGGLRPWGEKHPNSDQYGPPVN